MTCERVRCVRMRMRARFTGYAFNVNGTLIGQGVKNVECFASRFALLLVAKDQIDPMMDLV